jgi:hypothetical protein
MEHEVALAERSPLGILARQSDRNALGQQRSEGQRFGVGPLNATFRTEHGPPPLQLFPQLGMDAEPLRPAVQLVVQRLQELGRQRRVDLLSRSAQPHRPVLRG